jgi:hypothetical protein
LKTDNVGYHPAQNNLSSNLLSKNTGNKTGRTIILFVVLNGFETWALILSEMFENRVLRKIFWAQEGLGKRRIKKTTL